MNRRFFTKAGVLLMILALLLSFAGCSSESSKSEKAEYGNHAPAEPNYALKEEVTMDSAAGSNDAMMDMEAPSLAPESTALPDNRKLIRTVRMTIETESLDPLLKQLDSQIAQLSGYVEYQNVYHGSAYSGTRSRTADLTIRIPADQLNTFTQQVSQNANVVTSSQSVNDVTLSYVSTESRMNALRTEETRLLELLAKAETMEDLLTIESRLTDVRWEIEQVTSTLRVYDNQVDYATIHLNISEVTEFTVVEEPPVTLGDRIRSGVRDTLDDIGTGLEDFLVFVIVNIPYIAIFVIVPLAGLIIFLCVRRKKKKSADAA